MWLFVLFLAVPIIEIALFIQVGGWIGLWPTLAIVILTAILGTWLVRTQGALALAQLRNSMEQLRDPTQPLAHGAMILFAGALLLTPGFFTDTLGLALLVPPVRQAVYEYLRKRVKVQQFGYGTAARHEPYQTRHGGPDNRPGDVIDGDYAEVPPEKKPTHDPKGPPSGWTRH